MEDMSKGIMARMYLVLLLLLVVPAAIVVQILRIQFMEGDNLRALWSQQALQSIPIQAQRGHIIDSEGRLLVANNISYQVAVDPFAPGTTPEDIRNVISILGQNTLQNTAHYQRIYNQAPRGSRYIVLARNVNRDVRDLLYQNRFRGLIIEEQYKRRYNYNELASHVLGYVNHQLTGMSGVESQYDRFLRGQDGIQQVRRDSRGRIKEFVGAPRKQPIQGHTIQTTLNAQVQAILEDELRLGVERARAKSGTAIVLNPQTGAIVAMANYPSFNPNAPGVLEGESRRNNAIADMIEPGSTFKLITAVAAIEQGAVTMDEIFETPDNGRRLIHGQWMRDHDPLGTLTFQEVIQRSSNVATAEVAMRLERDVFFQYARNAGFGTTTGIDLPGEESGRLRRPYDWSLVSLPWMSIGYEVQATPLQIALSYAAMANGGKLMRPYVVERVLDEAGTIVHENNPFVTRHVFSPAALELLKPAFEGVVTSSGTAQFAAIDGLRIAGKTGTAQKFIDGQYRNRYRASFVGYFPVENPQYVTLVLLDEPRTSIYGGFMAGPIFRNVANRILGVDPAIKQYISKEDEPLLALRTPRLQGMDINQASKILNHQKLPFMVKGNGDVILSQTPAPGSELEPGQPVELVLGTRENGENRVPDVTGLSMRDAVVVLQNAGYTVTRNGSGTVSAQFPEGGAIMQAGRSVTIRGRVSSMDRLLIAGGGQ